MSPFVGFVPQPNTRRQKSWSLCTHKTHKCTQTNTVAEAANWLAQTTWLQGSHAGCLTISEVNWKRKQRQQIILVSVYAPFKLMSWQWKRHLFPGKSCHLPRFRFWFQHLLFLTASCQKFGERIADWRTHAWLDAQEVVILTPLPQPPFAMAQCICQHLPFCPYHSNAMVQS